MIILTVMGNPHNGNTKAITDLFLAEFEGNEAEIDDIVLPQDMPELCVGCAKCILQGEEYCPHYAKMERIIRRMESADVIVFATPVYAMSCSAAMKNLMDHLAYMWMNHRPNEKMFRKVGMIITTSGGWGEKDTLKLLEKNLFYLGFSGIHSYSITTSEMEGNFGDCTHKDRIRAQMHKQAEAVKKDLTHRKPGLKTRFYFSLFRVSQKSNWNKTDSRYWKRKGWLDGKNPF